MPNPFSGVVFTHPLSLWDLAGFSWEGEFFTASHQYPKSFLPGGEWWWFLSPCLGSIWDHFCVLVNTLCTLLVILFCSTLFIDSWFHITSEFITCGVIYICWVLVLCSICCLKNWFYPAPKTASCWWPVIKHRWAVIAVTGAQRCPVFVLSGPCSHPYLYSSAAFLH